MLGLKKYEHSNYIEYDASVAATSTNTFVITFTGNMSTRFEVGDPVVGFSSTVTKQVPSLQLYVNSISVAGGGATTDVSLNGMIQSSATPFKVQIGTLQKAKRILPGKITLEPIAQVYQATPGSPTLTCYNAYKTINAGPVRISGVQYTINSVTTLSNGQYQITLSTNYGGQQVNNAAAIVNVFDLTVKAYTTESWVDYLFADISNKGYTYVWIGEDQLKVTNVAANVIDIAGETAISTYDGGNAFYWGYGYERAIIFKAANVNIKTARVTLESDFKGTNVVVTTKRSDGVASGNFKLGGLAEVQTVTFRSTGMNPLTDSLNAAAANTQFTLKYGPEFNINLVYGSTANDWKTAIESATGNRVTISRSGDGQSVLYSYGYSYTITFWGAYGTEGIPQLKSIATNLVLFGIEISHDTIQQAEILPDFSPRYIALDESRTYAVRMRGFNAKGMSEPSNILVASTELYGGLPSKPQGVVVGAFASSDTLSLFYQQPILGGGLPITSYLIEYDSKQTFDPKSKSYNSITLKAVPEIQQITSYFRAGDDVKVRGGYFTLTFGGFTTGLLSFDISAYDLEAVINSIVGTRQVAVAPVTVTRKTWNRGFKWSVTFSGIKGNVGLMQIDYSMILGDDARMVVEEITAGSADIVPDSYTLEVQTVRTQALTAITQGSFKLSMEGYTTSDISYNEEYITFKQKLEALKTIFGVKVRRDVISTPLNLYAWTITFSRMRKDRGQFAGAGNIPPFTVSPGATAFVPSDNSATVQVFEVIKGTYPLQLSLTNLSPAMRYYVKVTSYNERGYSLEAAMTSAVTLGQPLKPIDLSVSVQSGTSLKLSWSMPALDNLVSSDVAYSVDYYKIAYYTSIPVQEVQVITTSASPSLLEIQRVTVESDFDNLAGYFKLEFNGETTRNIPWNAQAYGQDSVGQNLGYLSTLGPVEISRSHSKRTVQGLRVQGTHNDQFFTVTYGSCASLVVGDTIYVADFKYKIVAPGCDGNILNIDSTITLPTFSEAFVYKWTYGYSWDITFTNQIGDISSLIAYSSDNWAGTNPVIRVDTIRHGVAPLSGTFKVGYGGARTTVPCDISADGMKAAIESLPTVAEVFVQRFPNKLGYDWQVTFISEVGNVDSMVVYDAGLSGSFARAEVNTMIDGVTPDSYKELTIQDMTARSYVISSLQNGISYQLRLSAHNVKGFSYPAVATPAFVAPKEAPKQPYNATLIVLSPSQIKVIWQKPSSNGGSNIERYRIEWDIASDFTNVAASGN
jgi:hypothetical protein